MSRKRKGMDDVLTPIPRPMLNGEPLVMFEGEIISDDIHTFLSENGLSPEYLEGSGVVFYKTEQFGELMSSFGLDENILSILETVNKVKTKGHGSFGIVKCGELYCFKQFKLLDTDSLQELYFYHKLDEKKHHRDSDNLYGIDYLRDNTLQYYGYIFDGNNLYLLFNVIPFVDRSKVYKRSLQSISGSTNKQSHVLRPIQIVDMVEHNISKLRNIQKLHIFQKILLTVESLNKLGILCSDIKLPGNILFNGANPIIIDFGISVDDMKEELYSDNVLGTLGWTMHLSPYNLYKNPYEMFESSIPTIIDKFSIVILLFNLFGLKIFSSIYKPTPVVAVLYSDRLFNLLTHIPPNIMDDPFYNMVCQIFFSNDKSLLINVYGDKFYQIIMKVSGYFRFKDIESLKELVDTYGIAIEPSSLKGQRKKKKKKKKKMKSRRKSKRKSKKKSKK